MPRKKPLSMHPEAVKSRNQYAKKKAAQTAKPTSAPPIEPIESEETSGFAISAESAPEQTFESRSVLQDILGALGLSKQPSQPGKKVPIHLTKKQQEFVDNVTPLGSSALIASFAWAWGRLGEPYRQCAPDEAVSIRIVEPLIRIYARQAKFIESLDPNTADWLASLSATVGYGLTSLTMFDMITAQLREQEEMQNGRGFARTYESGYSSANNGRADTVSSHDATGQQAQPGATAFNPGNLSERERLSYEKLSALRNRDIAARARRSGQYGLS